MTLLEPRAPKQSIHSPKRLTALCCGEGLVQIPQTSWSKLHYRCLIFLLLFFVPTGPFLLPRLPPPPKSLLLPLHAPIASSSSASMEKKKKLVS